MTRVLVISFTDLASDPRVDRQIGFLRTRHEIVAAGLTPPRQTVNEFVELPAFKRTMLGKVLGLVRLLAHRYEGIYWTHPAHLAALNRLRHVRVDAVVANDLDALPLALRLGPPVAFDAHEYAPLQFAELAWWRILIAPYIRWLCQRYVPQVRAMTTVSEGIAAAYDRETGVTPAVVTNAPPRTDIEPTPVHDPIRILHHGGAQRGRGLEEMIRLGDLLDDRFTLDFVLVEASRGYRDKLVRLANRNPRVRFPEPWPMQDLVQRANDYDIGLYSLPPLNFNRRFALPNKFFEFVQARLAVAVGPSPEMARLVRQYGCGIVADDFTPESIAEALGALDVGSIASFKQSSHAAADDLGAEHNAKLVRDSIEKVLAYGRTSVGTR
jgi:hypothetical protein